MTQDNTFKGIRDDTDPPDWETFTEAAAVAHARALLAPSKLSGGK